MCSTSTTTVALGCLQRRDPGLDEMRYAGFHGRNRVPEVVLVLSHLLNVLGLFPVHIFNNRNTFCGVLTLFY